MSYYMHIEGKKGRPTRFDDKNLATLAAIAIIMDERIHMRGRKPTDSVLTIVDTGETVAIADSWTTLCIKLHDSTKVAKAYKRVPRHGDGTPIAPTTLKAIKRGCKDSLEGKVTTVKIESDGSVTKTPSLIGQPNNEPAFVPASEQKEPKRLKPRVVDLSKLTGKLGALQKEVEDKKLVIE